MVTAERYQEVMAANRGKRFPMMLGAVEVGLLHGALRLMLLHPKVEDFSASFIGVAEGLRVFCLEVYSYLGFTKEEIDYLDSAFEFKGDDPF